MELLYDQIFDEVPDSVNSNLENEGFGTTLILYNLGSMIIAILSFPVLAIYSSILRLFIPVCKGTIKKSCKKKRESLEETLYWTQPIVTYTESYAVLSMCTLINLRFMDFDEKETRLTSSLTIILLSIQFILPIAVALILFCYWDRLEEEKIKTKFGSIYENLNLQKGRWVILVPVTFLLRRFILALIVVYPVPLTF